MTRVYLMPAVATVAAIASALVPPLHHMQLNVQSMIFMSTGDQKTNVRFNAVTVQLNMKRASIHVPKRAKIDSTMMKLSTTAMLVHALKAVHVEKELYGTKI